MNSRKQSRDEPSRRKQIPGRSPGPRPPWLGPPRRLLFSFLAVAMVLVGVMLWLGWRLVRQDQELAAQRLQERRESATDLAAAALQKSLSRIEEQMTRLASLAPVERRRQAAADAGTLTDDCALILFQPDAAEAFPERRLPFYPAVPRNPEPPASLFAEAERLEFRQLDSAKAVEALREPARSPDPQIRAAALLRIARNYRKLGRWDEALAAYGELATVKAVQIEMLPPELIALQARLRVLEQANRAEAARQEATLLQDGLRERRWRLTRGAYEFHAGEGRPGGFWGRQGSPRMAWRHWPSPPRRKPFIRSGAEICRTPENGFCGSRINPCWPSGVRPTTAWRCCFSALNGWKPS